MKKQPLRVGFDLDGVLLYNPARIFRPIIVFFKRMFIPKEKNIFHLPKNRLQKIIWLFLHKSSFMVASGYEEIKRLTNNRKIKAYIISGRYDSLKEDFFKWLKKIEAEKYFTGFYYNSADEQPHKYKEKMIKKLKLDIFIEDNWDIVKYLNDQSQMTNEKCKIFWVFNFFDKRIPYKFKFPNLVEVAKTIKKQ